MKVDGSLVALKYLCGFNLGLVSINNPLGRWRAHLHILMRFLRAEIQRSAVCHSYHS